MKCITGVKGIFILPRTVDPTFHFESEGLFIVVSNILLHDFFKHWHSGKTTHTLTLTPPFLLLPYRVGQKWAGETLAFGIYAVSIVMANPLFVHSKVWREYLDDFVGTFVSLNSQRGEWYNFLWIDICLDYDVPGMC